MRADSVKLEGMSYGDLRKLRSRLDVAIANAQIAAREELRQRCGEIAREHGFTLKEIFAAGGRKGAVSVKFGTVPVKYRDPRKPENTWTGRGRMPRWLTAQIGKDRSKLERYALSR